LIIRSVCVVTQFSSISHFNKFLCVFNFLCKTESKVTLMQLEITNATQNAKLKINMQTELKNARQ
jgi:hypothetical protein